MRPLLGEIIHTYTVDFDCLDKSDQKDILKRLGYKWGDSARWLRYNISLKTGIIEQPVYNSPYKNDSWNSCLYLPANKQADLCTDGTTTAKTIEVVPASCIYNVGETVDGSIASVWKEMFSGVMTLGTWNYSSFNSTDPLVALYNAGSGKRTLDDVQRLMDNITEALTIHIRQTGSGGFSEPSSPVGVAILRSSNRSPTSTFLRVAGLTCKNQSIASPETVGDQRVEITFSQPQFQGIIIATIVPWAG